jgi:rRNA (uridine-N3-)-methyltransferase BTM5-like
MMQVRDKNVRSVGHGIEQYRGKNSGTRTGRFVVLFGEATFEFAVQYAQRHGDYRIVATEYRPFSELVSRDDWSKIVVNVKWLANNGVVVLFGVNATDQIHWNFIKTKYGAGQEINKVQWNDPHTSTYGEVESETNLMKGFFTAASSSLTQGKKLKMTYAGWPYLPSQSKEGQVDLDSIATDSFTVGQVGNVGGGKYVFNPQRTIGGNINDRLTYDQLSKQTFTKK